MHKLANMRLGVLSEGAFYILLIGVVTLAATVVARFWPFYRALLRSEGSDRFFALDGLRGVLAVSVFIHHAAFYTSYFRGTGWYVAHESFTFMIGAVSVAVFFMITGFLFWSKAIMACGNLNAWSFYVSRIRRIYPMLLFLLAANLLIVAVGSNGELREPPSQVIGEVSRWFLGGLAGFPVINSFYPVYHVSMTWTLEYESWFYLLLPLLAFLLWRPWRFAAAIGFAAILLPFAREYINYPNLAGFALGGIAAYCLNEKKEMPVKSAALSFGVVVLLAGLCWSSYHLPSFSWRFIAFPIFLAVLYGCTFFGMLTTNAWRLLGTVSYSIYLIHGTVLYVVLGTINLRYPLSGFSTAQLYLVSAGCALLVVAFSSITYRLIERPFMRRATASSKPGVQEAAAPLGLELRDLDRRPAGALK
jgi:peptidoglycan/LPS O-acetylase OafA/YrhL